MQTQFAHQAMSRFSAEVSSFVQTLTWTWQEYITNRKVSIHEPGGIKSTEKYRANTNRHKCEKALDYQSPE